MKQLLLSTMLLLMTTTVFAQQDEFERDLLKLMEVNGTMENYDLVFDQMIAQYKMMKKNVPDEIWESAKTNVFKVEIAKLNKQLTPFYKEQFTSEELKKMIEFYDSPIGKKMVKGTSEITKKGMQISQSWAMGLGSELNSFLLKNGF